MASLSLPRVLQLKKNSVDAEREQFEKAQTAAIQKAINSLETPVKEKHVRSTIIGTFREQSAITYWMVAVRLPLQDNRIVAWKFCHVTHKLLREGHPACLDDSQRHIGMIDNLGKLWVHLREGYGKLVHLYCCLLANKLRFHARNPRVPGHMSLSGDELDAIAENDVNNYFQLCVELFDYMDDILNLQAAVFDSVGHARANSMTASGQCRLAALLPSAQDSAHLYDANVRMLFRLHAALPPDTLAGHRERFRVQFKKLSAFYAHASSLQYYRNLLTLPTLPRNPPNFLLQSEFGTYVAPVVSVPDAPDEPDAGDVTDALVDTSDPGAAAAAAHAMSPEFDGFDTRTTPSPQPDPLMERDRLIDHLQNELQRMRSELSQMIRERNTMVSSMREHCTRLEAQVNDAQTELQEERQKVELITSETPEIKQKLSEVEEKAKVTDEKFQKLKSAYTQLREEHIKLIRTKAEVDKLAVSLRASAAEHESAKMALQQQLHDKIKDVEILQQSASSTEEIEAYKSEIANLRSDLEASRQKESQLETLRASLEALEIEHQTAKTEAEAKINIIASELVDVKANLDQIAKEKEDREVELNRVKEELLGLREKSGEEFNRVVKEKDEAVKQVAVLTEQYQQEKQEHELSMKTLQTHLDDTLTKLNDLETNHLADEQENVKYKEYCNKLIEEKDVEINNLLDKFNVMKDNNDKIEIKLTVAEKEISDLKDIVKEHNIKIEDILTERAYIESELKVKTDELISVKLIVESKDTEIQILHTTKEENLKRIQELEKYNLDLNSRYSQEVRANKNEFNLLESSSNDKINELKILLSYKNNEVLSVTSAMKSLVEDKAKLLEDLDEKEAELEITKNELIAIQEEHASLIRENDKDLSTKNQDIKNLKNEISKIVAEKQELIEAIEKLGKDLSGEKQMLESRLSHVEKEKITAECELQDLLQHNTDLENNLTVMKKQLDETKMELELNRQSIVKCAGAAALDVTNAALASLDCGNAQENNQAAADLAAKAFKELADNVDWKGKEALLARAAVAAAHGTAQMSSYAIDVASSSTDIELADKLTAECRSLLQSTQHCLQSLTSGSTAAPTPALLDGLVRSVRAAERAGRGGGGGDARSVDDELADMDAAIEEAAKQIEKMLEASRAGDSGIKLEVNGKILDACTTLMGAVKILVQDARTLQNELGDTKTRQKMYIRNPQWSEGLISAAKAVVFAAKLLVTSADEAVSSGGSGGAGGQVEGVSAAAHEVAGSTAQLVAASRARAPPHAPALSALTRASRQVAAATGALVAAVRQAAALLHDREALDTSTLSLTAARRLEHESKVRALQLEAALEAERARLAALRRRHYQLAQDESGAITNGNE